MGVEGMAKDPAHPWNIFISYRRSDAQAWVGRLADDLRDYFGEDVVYRDLDSNRSAHDYTRQIQEALTASRAVLVVMGPNWLDSRYPDGRRRLDDPEDLVRLEIERSLASGIAVIPVLVGHATAPSATSLPVSLQTLSRLQAQRLTDEDWDYRFGRLLETLDSHGIVHTADRTETSSPDLRQSMTRTKRYERTLPATRRRAYDALLGALELLRYPRVEESPRGAQVTFKVRDQPIVAKVVDAGPGQSKLVLEIRALSNAAWAGATAVSLFGGPLAWLTIGGWAGLRAMERRFAVGFLDNVQSVLEGRGVGEDSSLPPGVTQWRNRSREV